MAEIDLDPNFRYRQAAQNTFFTGMQLGGQIADRRAAMALRQQQMDMNQRELNARLAQMDIQNSEMKLQNQARDLQLTEAVEEKRAQVADFRLYSQFMRDLDNWKLNPIGRTPPERPDITSKQFNASIDAVMNQSKEMLPAYQLGKEIEETRKFKTQQQAERIRLARELEGSTNEKIIKDDPNALGGIGIDDAALARAQAADRERKQSIELLRSMPMGVRPEALKAVPGLNLTPQQIEVISSMSGGFPTAAERNTRAGVDARVEYLNSIGIEPDEKAVAKLKSQLQLSGGRLAPLPAKEASQLNNDFAALEAIDVFNEDIKKFEADYGPGSFKNYLGFLPQKYQDIETRLREATSDKDKEAFAILSEFSGVRNGVLKTRSGQTVTQQEQQRVNSEIGSEGDKNTLIRINRFRRNKENEVRGVIERFSDNLLPSYYQDYALTPRGTSVYNFTAQRIQEKTAPKAGGKNLIDMDSIDAEMRKRGLSPTQ